MTTRRGVNPIGKGIETFSRSAMTARHCMNPFSKGIETFPRSAMTARHCMNPLPKGIETFSHSAMTTRRRVNPFSKGIATKPCRKATDRRREASAEVWKTMLRYCASAGAGCEIYSLRSRMTDAAGVVSDCQKVITAGGIPVGTQGKVVPFVRHRPHEALAEDSSPCIET